MGFNGNYPMTKDMDGQTKLHRVRYHMGRAFVKPGDFVNDLGCGQGYGSNIISEVGANVTGIDMDEGQLIHNRETYPHIQFLVEDLENCVLPDADVSVSFEVIEHTYNPAKYVQNIKDHTKKYIIVSVPFGCEKLVTIDGVVQADLDSTHHSVFDRPEDLDNLFLDDKWAQFYSFKIGVTYLSIYYNREAV